MSRYPLQTTIVDNVTTGEVEDQKYLHRKLNAYVSPTDFDCDPTGVTDVGSGLNDAMAAATAADVPLVLRGTFKTSQTFDVTGDVDGRHCLINYTGSGAQGRVDIPGTDLNQGRVLHLPRITRPSELWSANSPAADVGWSIRYLSGSELHIPYVARFTYGVLFDPQTGDANFDNLIFLGALLDNMIQFAVAPAGTGYANHNKAFGGDMQQDLSHGRRTAGTRKILIAAATNAVNGWTFYDPELQGKTAEAAIECWGNQCRFVNPEFEQGADTVVTDAEISGTTTLTLSAADLAAGKGFNANADAGMPVSGTGIPAGTKLVAGGFGVPDAEGKSATATLSQACTNGTGLTVTMDERPVVMWRSSGGNTATQNRVDHPSGVSALDVTELRDAGVSYKDNQVEGWHNGNTIARRGPARVWGSGGNQSYAGNTLGYGTGAPQSGVSMDPVADIPSGTTPVEAGVGVQVVDGTHNRRIKLFVDETAGVAGLLATYTSGVPKVVIAIANTEHFSIDPTNNIIKLGVAGQKLALFGTAGAARQQVNGSRSASTVSVLTQLLAALGSASGVGIITDSTSA